MNAVNNKLGSIQFDHKLWLTELAFAFNEITLYQRRLLDLLVRYFDTDQKELEVLLNEFLRHKKRVKQMQLQIQRHKTEIVRKTLANGELKSLTNSFHYETRNMLEMFRKDYIDTKKKFHHFVAIKD